MSRDLTCVIFSAIIDAVNGFFRAEQARKKGLRRQEPSDA